jgi:ABC-type sulfate transport system permease subunit
MGLGRFATIFCVTLVVQAPAIAWAILVPGLIVHTTFGVLSGLVSAPLVARAVRPVDQQQKEEDEQAGDRRRPDAHRIASDA